MIHQGGFWHIVQASGVLSQLGLQRGLVHDRLWIDGVGGRSKCDHLAELGPVPSDAIEQHPLKVNNPIDHAL